MFFPTDENIEVNRMSLGNLWKVAACAWGVFSVSAGAADWYVKTNGSDAASGTNWATAKATIQAAVDAAADGEVVWVTNGVYDTGGATNRIVGSALTNRVAIYKPLTVRSVNGPAVTFIVGSAGSGGGGISTVRCVSLTNGAFLGGFTLTNGHTTGSVGSSDGCGGGVWGAYSNAVVSNCVITGCTAWEGGGAYVGRLEDCRIVGNDAGEGGGISYSPGSPARLLRCVLFRNSTYNWGGGAYNGELVRCEVVSNFATSGGGGAMYSTLSNCVVNENYGHYGGAAFGCTLANCLMISNTAGYGGGAYRSTLNNCTVAGNRVSDDGGGVLSCTLYNCIVYYNQAPEGPNWYVESFGFATSIYFSCTTPLPPKIGNFTDEPLFVDGAGGNYRLTSNSPCVNTGFNQNWMVSARDLDGSNRIAYGVVDLGAYEYNGPLILPITAATVAGPAVTLTNRFVTNTVSVVPPGAATPLYYSWSPAPESGQGSTQAVYRFATPGTKVLTVQVSNLYGRAVGTGVVHIAVASNSYVAVTGSDTNDGFRWASAKRTIQAGVDAVSTGYTVWVSNGVYDTGGRPCGGQTLTNRVSLDKFVIVRSVNGPEHAVIVGQADPFDPDGEYGPAAVRGAYLTNRAVLAGFTVSGGRTDHQDDFPFAPMEYGGGIYCVSTQSVVSNCWVMQNAAYRDGGGVMGGTLQSCLIQSNRAGQGGGVAGDMVSGGAIVLSNCVLEGNSTWNWGGGAYNARMYGCRVSGNQAASGGGGAVWSVLYGCVLESNTANSGGGVQESTAFSCVMQSNAAVWGGGAERSQLVNCTLIGNSASQSGGGAANCALSNCIVWFNSAPEGTNWFVDEWETTNIAYTCALPLPPGPGNTAADPALRDAAAGDWRLATNSPCVDKGTNQAWMTGALDVEGKARVLNVRVDMGACELVPPSWDSNTNGLPDWWEWDYSHSFTGMSATADGDGDRVINRDEYGARTIPTNSDSFLGMLSPPLAGGPTGLVVRWRSVKDRTYQVDRATNLVSSAAFTNVFANVPGQAEYTSVTDATATAAGPYLYRVRTQP